MNPSELIPGRRLRISWSGVICLTFTIFCYDVTAFVNCLDTIVKSSDNSKDLSTASDILLIEANITKIHDNEESLLSFPTDDSNTDESTSINNGNQHIDRRWGSSGTGTGTSSSPASTTPNLLLTTEVSDVSQKEENLETDDDVNGETKQQPQRRWGSSQQQASSGVPKIGKNSVTHINPPDGFAITARVFIDENDKLTHFDRMEETNGENSIVLPYYDCGVSGATTAALLVKQIYFRHALSSPTTVYIDQSSTDSKLVLYPVLAVALTSLRVELDSGEHMDFVAGDAILFEDTIRPGHLLMVSKESKNLTVLLITLPNKHHHIGKQYLSIKAALTSYAQKATPCSVSKKDDKKISKFGDPEFENLNLNTSKTLPSTPINDINSAHAIFSDTGRRIRLALFATIAFSLSTLMADFLGRTAPLWLAVGVGGSCFVLGSTYAITIATDFIFTAISLWHERRKLGKKRNESANDYQ